MIIETGLKKVDQLTYNRLKKLLDYNTKTGNLIWKVFRQGTKGIGSIAGYISPADGYVYIGIDYVLYKAHRLAWFWMKGKFPNCYDLSTSYQYLQKSQKMKLHFKEKFVNGN